MAPLISLTSDAVLKVGGAPVLSVRRGADVVWQPQAQAGPVEHVATQLLEPSNTATTVTGISSGDLVLITSVNNSGMGSQLTVSGCTVLATWDGGAENLLQMRQQWGVATDSTFTVPAWGSGFQVEQGVIHVFRNAAVGAFAVSAVGVQQYPALTLAGPAGGVMVVCTAAAGSWHGVNTLPSGYTDLRQLRAACVSRSNGYVSARDAESFSGFGGSRGSSTEIVPA